LLVLVLPQQPPIGFVVFDVDVCARVGEMARKPNAARANVTTAARIIRVFIDGLLGPSFVPSRLSIDEARPRRKSGTVKNR